MDWLATSEELAPFDWWRSSRVHFGTSDITEFPYWSFLFGDVHPHLMGIPFFVSVLVVALIYFATAMTGDVRRTSLLAVLFGVLLAMVRMVHTWDFPTGGADRRYGALRAGCWAGDALAASGHAGAMLLLAAGVAQCSRCRPWPYQRFQQPGVIRSATRTPPQQFFAHFGIFLAIAAAYAAVRYYEEARRGNKNNLVVFFGQREWLFATATLSLCMALFANEQGYMVLALATMGLVILGNLIWVELRRDAPAVGEIVATALLFGGVLVAAAVDLVTVKDDIGRMNTVFKFSLQAWHLFALGSSFAAVYVVAFLLRIRAPAKASLSRALLWGVLRNCPSAVVRAASSR